MDARISHLIAESKERGTRGGACAEEQVQALTGENKCSPGARARPYLTPLSPIRARAALSDALEKVLHSGNFSLDGCSLTGRDLLDKIFPSTSRARAAGTAGGGDAAAAAGGQTPGTGT